MSRDWVADPGYQHQYCCGQVPVCQKRQNSSGHFDVEARYWVIQLCNLRWYFFLSTLQWKQSDSNKRHASVLWSRKEILLSLLKFVLKKLSAGETINVCLKVVCGVLEYQFCGIVVSAANSKLANLNIKGKSIQEKFIKLQMNKGFCSYSTYFLSGFWPCKFHFAIQLHLEDKPPSKGLCKTIYCKAHCWIICFHDICFSIEINKRIRPPYFIQ